MPYRTNALSTLELMAVDLGRKWHETSHASTAKAYQTRKEVRLETEELQKSIGYKLLRHFDTFLGSSSSAGSHRYYIKENSLMLLQYFWQMRNPEQKKKFIYEWDVGELCLFFVPEAERLIAELKSYAPYRKLKDHLYHPELGLVNRVINASVKGGFDEQLLQAVQQAMGRQNAI